ncbi:hypothetical protein R1flu_020735 [Riccia fluitans]|uniref:Uncharacterized protein n=1 Tax=Riccia fluitans TaxID=41844 RepID=A0ABD1ZMC2_9MARC
MKEVGLLCMLFLVLASVSQSDSIPEQLYLVKLRSYPKQTEEQALYLQRTLLAATLSGEEKVNGCLIYSFTKAFDGFAAKLTPTEVDKITNMQGVLSVIPNAIFNTTTTNSWKFLGVESQTTPNTGALWKQAKFGQDVIIGMIDTGIWPESISFNDNGLGPIPSKWKGTCVEGGAFASADWNGFAAGTAKGGAPRARIAVYKVCWSGAGCSLVDMAAAMEDAIADGVDLMSISISGFSDAPFYQDIVGITSFHAMKKGVLVNFAAGNAGPALETTNHNEPWSLTVAATSQDRFLGADVLIKPTSGSQPGLRFKGAAFTHFPTLTAPLFLASEASFSGDDSAAFCSDSSTLDSSRITGKIVFCLQGAASESVLSKSENVRLAGGTGVIIGNTKGVPDYTLRPDNHNIPAAHLNSEDAQLLVDYVKECDLNVCVFRDGHVQATIFPGKTYLQFQPAPVMAWFSSNGPSGVTTDILKVYV